MRRLVPGGGPRRCRVKEGLISNRRFLILGGILVFGILVSFLFGRLGNPLGSVAFRDLKIQFDRYPLQIGAWRGEDRPLTAEVIEKAGLDRYLRRQYEDDQGRSVLFYVGYCGNKDRGLQTIYHNPTVCFPFAGWEWIDSVQRPITLTDRAMAFRVSLDTFRHRRSGRELLVLNFFIVDEREVVEEAPRNKPVWLALEKLKPSLDPGYFAQVQVVAECGEGREEAAARAIRFLETAGGRLFLHF